MNAGEEGYSQRPKAAHRGPPPDRSCILDPTGSGNELESKTMIKLRFSTNC